MSEARNERGPTGEALAGLARLHEDRGEHSNAAHVLERAVALFREVRNIPALASALDASARVAAARQDFGAARVFAVEALRLRRERRPAREVLFSLDTFALVALRQDQAERAARLWGASEALRAAAEFPWTPLHRREIEQNGVAHARAALGEVAFRNAWNAGRSLTLPDALALACDDAQNDKGSTAA
jgi:hypothetical protein